MAKKIRLAAINTGDVAFPAEADPYGGCFDREAPAKFIKKNIEKNLEFMHKAGMSKADLVCTHEDFTGSAAFMLYLDHPEIFSSLAEDIPGPVSEKICEIAKYYGMYIAANYFEREGDKFYNTSVLIDRNGRVAGKYRKVHLPPYEKWRISAGNEFPVFDTDIGRIGFAICYDVIFPEHCKAVALNGADIIIHQTAGWGLGASEVGDALVRVRAAENSVCLVVAKNIQSDKNCGKSCVIDNKGNILAEAPGTEEKVVIAEFEPDYDLINSTHFDSFYSGVESVKARHVLERLPSLYSIIIDKNPPVLDRFKGVRLHDTPEEIEEILMKRKAYFEAVKNNKSLEIEYHW